MKKENFDDVKVGDTLILQFHNRWYGDEFREVKVEKASKTRFSVTGNLTGHCYEFLRKNGENYPRSQGYSSTFHTIRRMTDELKEEMEFSVLRREVRSSLKESLSTIQAHWGNLDVEDQVKLAEVMKVAAEVIIEAKKKTESHQNE